MKNRGDSGGMTRRQFGVMAGGVVVGYALQGACRPIDAAPSAQGRLTARPGAGRDDVATTNPGAQALGLASARDAILQLPARVAQGPLPLLVLLHGAGGSGAGVLRRVGGVAEQTGIAVLAPDSRGSTWDAIRGGFGPDVAFLNLALGRVFGMIAVDPARLAVGGFSDGATYALSLGLINGDLFQSRRLRQAPGGPPDNRHRPPKTRHGAAAASKAIDMQSVTAEDTRALLTRIPVGPSHSSVGSPR